MNLMEFNEYISAKLKFHMASYELLKDILSIMSDVNITLLKRIIPLLKFHPASLQRVSLENTSRVVRGTKGRDD